MCFVIVLLIFALIMENLIPNELSNNNYIKDIFNLCMLNTFLGKLFGTTQYVEVKGHHIEYHWKHYQIFTDWHSRFFFDIRRLGKIEEDFEISTNMGIDMKVKNYCDNQNYDLIIEHLDVPSEIHCDTPIMSTFEIMDLNCKNHNFISTDQTIEKTVQTPSIIHRDEPFMTTYEIQDCNNCKNQNFISTDLNTNQIVDHSTIGISKEEMATPSIPSEIGKPTQSTNLTSHTESPNMNGTSSVASICSISPIKIIPVVENRTGDLKPVGCQFSLLSCSIGSALFNLSLNDSEDETTDEESSDDEDDVDSGDEDDSIIFEDPEGDDVVDCSRLRIPSESESDDGIAFQDLSNKNGVDEVDFGSSNHHSNHSFKIYEDEILNQASNFISINKNKRALKQRISSESEDGLTVLQNDGNDSNCTAAKKSTSGKKVQFATNLCNVRRILHWDFAHRAARKGPWMQMSTDRCRFKVRIFRCANALNKILDLSHREKIYNERFLDSANQC